MTGPDNITLKHTPTRKYMCMEGTLDVDDPYSEAKLETRHYTMAKRDGHSMIDVGGAYIMYFDDYMDRICNVTAEVSLLQQAYPNSRSHENIRQIDGFLAVSAYHMGRLDDIQATYRKAIEWADAHGIELAGSAYERYVIDIYTSDDPDEYITEILLLVNCCNEDFNYLSSDSVQFTF